MKTDLDSDFADLGLQPITSEEGLRFLVKRLRERRQLPNVLVGFRLLIRCRHSPMQPVCRNVTDFSVASVPGV